jgi:hypothetical protein
MTVIEHLDDDHVVGVTELSMSGVDCTAGGKTVASSDAPPILPPRGRVECDYARPGYKFQPRRWCKTRPVIDLLRFVFGLAADPVRRRGVASN